MNKKGFTLIELLAVIVILAIIALIATPIILGIINDAREKAKVRSSELVYAGVEYAYTTSMYQLESATGDIKLKDIYDNFQVENTTKQTNPEVTTSSTEFSVTTAEGVICTISTDTNGYQVKCGTEEGDDAYLSKLVQTTSTLLHNFTPQYYTVDSYTIGDDQPEEDMYDPRGDGVESYLGYDIKNGVISAGYACFIKGDNEYCLKYGQDSYTTNIQILNEAFGESSCSDDENLGYACQDVDGISANIWQNGGVHTESASGGNISEISDGYFSWV